VGVAGGSDYIDARVPGLQAAFEKAEVAMAMAAFTGQSFSIAASGGLDSGKVFSAVQFILEREMGQGLWRLGRGIRVDEETLALETIERVGVGEGKSYLETDHTLRHYRQTWFPTYLARGMWEDDEQEFGHQQRMMDEAYAHYQACLEEYEPPELAVGVGDEIDRIIQAARSALLT
jgi:trimethylamine--corrinoid protein Co-methyltransferase